MSTLIMESICLWKTLAFGKPVGKREDCAGSGVLVPAGHSNPPTEAFRVTYELVESSLPRTWFFRSFGSYR